MNLNNQNLSMLKPTKLQRKKRLNEEQVRLLEASFDCNKKLDPEMKLQLARQLSVPPRQIAIWYQNKRARWKSQSFEIGYNALQVRLDDALLKKKQLEEQVKHLEEELQKAREYAQLPPSSISSSGNEGGGSGSLPGGGGGGTTTSLDDDVSYPWMNNSGDRGGLSQLFQGGELTYACFLMSGQGEGDMRWQNDDNVLSSIINLQTRKM